MTVLWCGKQGETDWLQYSKAVCNRKNNSGISQEPNVITLKKTKTNKKKKHDELNIFIGCSRNGVHQENVEMEIGACQT